MHTLMRGLGRLAGGAAVSVPFLPSLEDVCRRLLVADRSGMTCFGVLRCRVALYFCIYCICALFVIIRGGVKLFALLLGDPCNRSNLLFPRSTPLPPNGNESALFLRSLGSHMTPLVVYEDRFYFRPVWNF